MEKFDVIVVGAGISGCATAYSLANTGAKVAIIDRYGPAAMASGWTLAGVRQSGRDPAELPLAMEAVGIWQTLHEDLGKPTHYSQRGNLRLARTESEYEQIKMLVASQREQGLGLSFLPDNTAVRAVAPAVSEAILGASFCPTDGHADPQATSAAYVDALVKLGVTLIMGEAVEKLDVQSGKVCGVSTASRRIAADRIVLAAGMFGNDLLKQHGLSVPIEPPMVTVIRTAPLPPVLDQVIGVCGGDWAGRQEVTGRLRVTSGALTWNGKITTIETANGLRPVIRPPLSSLMEVIDKLRQLLPGLETALIEECWAGLLDLTPDALPVLDHAPGIEGLIVGMGFSGHGFCLGPVTGRILSDLALDRQPNNLGAFKFDRFERIGRKASLELHG